MNIGTSRSGPGGPIAMFYVFTVKGPDKFRFVWHNTTGDIVDSCALPNNDPATGQPYEPGQSANGCFPGVSVHGRSVGANLASIMDRLGPVAVELGPGRSLGSHQNGEPNTCRYSEPPGPPDFLHNPSA